MLPLLAVIVGVVVCGRQATLVVKPTQHPEKLKLRENPRKRGELRKAFPEQSGILPRKAAPGMQSIHSLAGVLD